MICSQCKNRNPIGNKFCRECGAKLTAPEGSLAAEEAARMEAERLQERVAGLLTEAFAHSERNEDEKAIERAEEAATLMPTSTSAHALLASLYERTDQERKAIAAMERVVEMNPDSAADREKLDQMRRGVHVLPKRETDKAASATASIATANAKRSEDAPPAWLPVAAATAVTVAVLGIGLTALNVSAQRHVRDNQADPYANSAGFLPSSPITVAQVPSSSASANGAAPSNLPPGWTTTIQNRADPFAPVSGGGGTATTSAAAAEQARTRAAGLPAPGSSAPINAPAPRRMASSDSGGGSTAAVVLPPISSNGDASGFGTGGRIVVGPPGGANNNAAPIQIPVGPPPSPARNVGSVPTDDQTVGGAPPQRQGYIRISVSQPTNSNGGGASSSASTAAPASSGDPMTRAQSLQASGRYREAIGAYRQAISEGRGSAGEAYQGIGLSYQRLSDEAAARDAYKQAISAYEAQISSGRGAAAAQRGIASCKAALEYLGGSGGGE